jgi:hypothetical protein
VTHRAILRRALPLPIADGQQRELVVLGTAFRRLPQAMQERQIRSRALHVQLCRIHRRQRARDRRFQHRNSFCRFRRGKGRRCRRRWLLTFGYLVDACVIPYAPAL